MVPPINQGEMKMTTAEKALERKLAKLCRKFYEDVQAVFDCPEMNDNVYAGRLAQAALSAQAFAEDASNESA